MDTMIRIKLKTGDCFEIAGDKTKLKELGALCQQGRFQNGVCSIEVEQGTGPTAWFPFQDVVMLVHVEDQKQPGGVLVPGTLVPN